MVAYALHMIFLTEISHAMTCLQTTQHIFTDYIQEAYRRRGCKCKTNDSRLHDEYLTYTEEFLKSVIRF